MEQASYLHHIDKIEDILETQRHDTKEQALSVIKESFYPSTDANMTKVRLYKVLGESFTSIYKHLLEVQSNCPPWTWDILIKRTRQEFMPDLLIKAYFELKKQGIKDINLDDEIDTRLFHYHILIKLRQLGVEMIKAMVSISTNKINDYPSNKTIIYCHEKKTSMYDAVRISKLLVEKKHPMLNLIKSPIKNDSLLSWERKLVALLFMTSNKSYNNFVQTNLDCVPIENQLPYLKQSSITTHLKKLNNYKISLLKFYSFNNDLYSNGTEYHVDSDVKLKVIMASHAKMYAFMIVNHSFFSRLYLFIDRLKLNYELSNNLFIFMNLISLRNNSYSNYDILGDDRVILENEKEYIEALHSENDHIGLWGYYTQGFLIEPLNLLKQFAEVKSKCDGNFSILKQLDITTFNIHDSYQFVHIIPMMMEDTSSLPKGVWRKTNYPYEIGSEHNISLLKQLQLVFKQMNQSYLNDAFNEYAKLKLDELERVVIGLSFLFHKVYKNPNCSQENFLSIIDACYLAPLDKRKLGVSIKTANKVLKNFERKNYSLVV